MYLDSADAVGISCDGTSLKRDARLARLMTRLAGHTENHLGFRMSVQLADCQLCACIRPTRDFSQMQMQF